MKLDRLSFPQHPRPPQRELRQRGVFDSGGNLIGYVDQRLRERGEELPLLGYRRGRVYGLRARSTTSFR